MDYNLHHRKFKRDMQSYNKSVNNTNRYHMKRISGKLNIFEGSAKEIRNYEDGDEPIELDRMIPGTDFVVLKKDGKYAIGDADGKPITGFDYIFIEGVFGNKNKQITCITEDGDMKIFDCEEKEIQESSSVYECDCGIEVNSVCVSDCDGNISDNASSSVDCSSNSHHEINYDDVKDGIILPFISKYRIKDMRSGKLLNKGIKHPKQYKHRKYPY